LASQRKQSATNGYSPLAFDFNANFWEENTRYHIPAMGAEIYNFGVTPASPRTIALLGFAVAF